MIEYPSEGPLVVDGRNQNSLHREVTLMMRRGERAKAKAGSSRDSDAANEAERIIAAVKRIPRGRVSTYGAIADVAGLPRRARLVGTVLKQTTARGVPWFRVINAAGRISFPAGSDAYRLQKKKLEAEGIVFRGDRVELQRYAWPPREHTLDEKLWRIG